MSVFSDVLVPVSLLTVSLTAIALLPLLPALSYRKVGGIRFLSWGRLQLSFCIKRRADACSCDIGQGRRNAIMHRHTCPAVAHHHATAVHITDGSDWAPRPELRKGRHGL